ncbi:uncharacterized protein LOC141715086 [Apium graveolens]|uniref:uncharacterized protein LOC141715086 n=1 Tax=Apium graveolens TaxID=4045 RepID=UPI003D7B5193
MSFIGGCMVQWSGDSTYLATVTEGGHEMVVDMDQHICACRKYQLTGPPCYHACGCIKWRNLDISQHIHKTYTKAMFLSCYTHTIKPINSEQYWEKSGMSAILPPIVKIAPGRPKKKKNTKNDPRPDPGATKFARRNTTVNCTHCGEAKHNARSCPTKSSMDLMNYLLIKIGGSFVP